MTGRCILWEYWTLPDIIFLTARNLGEDLELLFQVEGKPNFSHIVRRTVLGVGFPEVNDLGQRNHAYVCVAAERVWPNEMEDFGRPERQYIIIDEAEAVILSDLTAHIVRLKDTYLATTVYCPNDPIALVEGLKRAEGIAYYRQESTPMLRDKFPSFVSTLTKAAVRDIPVNLEAARQDINRMLDETLAYPGTDIPIYGAGDVPHRRLVTLTSGVNFHTEKADQAVQRSEPRYIVPVWMAVNGLDTSMAWGNRQKKQGHEWKGAERSGY
jgi:hypothetical protein